MSGTQRLLQDCISICCLFANFVLTFIKEGFPAIHVATYMLAAMGTILQSVLAFHVLFTLVERFRLLQFAPTSDTCRTIMLLLSNVLCLNIPAFIMNYAYRLALASPCFCPHSGYVLPAAFSFVTPDMLFCVLVLREPNARQKW